LAAGGTKGKNPRIFFDPDFDSDFDSDSDLDYPNIPLTRPGFSGKEKGTESFSAVS